jgi:tRNA-guanine family transglycosylase
VGEPKEEMIKVLDHVPQRLPVEKPRYLMGLASPRISSKPSAAALTCLIA